MLIRDIPENELSRRLRGEGIHLVTGAFTTRLQVSLPSLVGEFAQMYAHYPVEDPPGIDDALVRIGSRSRLGLARARRVEAWGEELMPLEPVPVDRAFMLLELAMNWATASSEIAPLILHSAVLERGGRALMLPAPPGSGKSTLCAALACSGWRMLSDEMGILRLEDGRLLPNPRPVSLKNESIDLIARFDPQARFSRVYRGTHKGDVAYMQAPQTAVDRAQETAQPRFVLRPSYAAGAAAKVRRMDKLEAFRCLTHNAVNYIRRLREGFDIVADLVERCAFYEFSYSVLEEAVQLISRLDGDSLAPGDFA